VNLQIKKTHQSTCPTWRKNRSDNGFKSNQKERGERGKKSSHGTSRVSLERYRKEKRPTHTIRRRRSLRRGTFKLRSRRKGGFWLTVYLQQFLSLPFVGVGGRGTREPTRAKKGRCRADRGFSKKRSQGKGGEEPRKTFAFPPLY